MTRQPLGMWNISEALQNSDDKEKTIDELAEFISKDMNKKIKEIKSKEDDVKVIEYPKPKEE